MHHCFHTKKLSSNNCSTSIIIINDFLSSRLAYSFAIVILNWNKSVCNYGDHKIKIKSNQIKSLLLSHHHSTSALVSEILMSVLQTVQKNNRKFTYGQTVQKKQQQQFTYGHTVQKNNNNNLHMDIQCKKTTAIYIWTVHIYRLYWRQCAKYTYIYSVHIVYYKDILNYQRHIIHRMGTSTLCTLSIHNVVYA